MEKTTDIIAFRQPESVDDPLTEIARDGARRMLAAALRAEADAFVAQYAEETLPDGRQRVGACCASPGPWGRRHAAEAGAGAPIFRSSGNPLSLPT